jgi:hypothetical protein
MDDGWMPGVLQVGMSDFIARLETVLQDLEIDPDGISTILDEVREGLLERHRRTVKEVRDQMEWEHREMVRKLGSSDDRHQRELRVLRDDVRRAEKDRDDSRTKMREAIRLAEDSKSLLGAAADDALYCKSMAELDKFVEDVGKVRESRRRMVMLSHRMAENNFSRWYEIVRRNFEHRGVKWSYNDKHRTVYINGVFLYDQCMALKCYFGVDKPLRREKGFKITLPADFQNRPKKWWTGEMVDDEIMVKVGQLFDVGIYNFFPIGWDEFVRLRDRAIKGRLRPVKRGEQEPPLLDMFM